MIPRIKSLSPMEDYCLLVTFDDGKTVLYDVKSDIRDIPSYIALTHNGLFAQVALDQSRTVVSWTDEIDLPSDAIYEYGKAENSSKVHS